MAGPLTGLRVIEAGEGDSAAYAAKLMADLGADVIKIEHPEQGDLTRRRGPFPTRNVERGTRNEVGGSALEVSGTFLYLNANKRGVGLDLTHPRGREALARLAGEADALIHNVPPAQMAEQGLAWDDLHRRNPRLVMTAISPFGQSGPYRDWKAYELTVANAGGWAWLIDPDAGSPDLPPLKAFGQQCHYQAGANAAIATLAALMARETHGAGGQHIDVSVQDCVMTFLEMNFIHYSYGGRVASRLGQRILHPWAILPAKDGLFFIVCVEEDQWQRFVEWMGTPEWSTWEVFGDRFQRAAAWDVLQPLLEEWSTQHTVEEIYRGGLERRIPVAPVSTMATLLENEQLRTRRYFASIAHPEAGALEYPGAPWILSATTWSLRSPAPLLGQHTEEVLTSAGFGHAELEKLRDEGVI